MFARSFSVHASPDQLDQATQQLEEATSSIEELDGFRGGYFLVDRASGDAMTVTLWESEEAMRASIPAAREILSGVMQGISGGSVSEPRAYEVAVELRASSS